MVCRSTASKFAPKSKGKLSRNVKQLLLEVGTDQVIPTVDNREGSLRKEEDKEIFMISVAGRDNQKKSATPVCQIKVDGIKITAFIDTGASMNVSEQFQKLKPQPKILPTKARIHTYGAMELIPLKDAITVQIPHGSSRTQTKFYRGTHWDAIGMPRG
ncbi:hypothetical protein NDU88_005326 [Pleurodeles waltl]|uniref:Uncharacterized protein n=1 Tax=Pleurodeles waltl TaxID=8319 RepID=A0AAV7SLD2_PLEWA|nr:hypothetical protein NDU88_005326 [Pleurodeles waltl]